MAITKKSPIDLSGMEFTPSREKLLSKWRDVNPKPTNRDIARREVMLSSMPDDAKLFAVAVIEFGGLSGPIPMSVREAQVLLSKSKDGAQSAAKKFSEWPHSMVEKSERGGKFRYGVMENILLKSVLPHRTVEKKCPDLVDTFAEGVEEKVSCPTGQRVGKVSCPTGQSLIGSEGEGGGVGVVFAESSPPTGVEKWKRALAPTTTLESPYPDLSKPDNAREFIGADEPNVHTLHDRLVAACNGALARGVIGLELVVEPNKWIAAGADLEQDILPVLSAMSKQVEAREGPGAIKSWRYYEGQVMSAMRRRTAPITEAPVSKSASIPPWRQEKMDRRARSFAILDKMDATKGEDNAK